jgi:hypothetical protein
MAQVLSEAVPTDKADVYAALGITVTYNPVQRLISAEARPFEPCTTERVGGGIRINTVGLLDASPAWGSSHVGGRIDGIPVREVGTTELWLRAA